MTNGPMTDHATFPHGESTKDPVREGSCGA
jgi:hypothetical protein